ncbi:TonB-dependent receptor, partial [Phenylobacterium sp.]|uniref:TonB-dependent receptor n=1 Tax=Phenylobacterium sp. TaxID=1871053 RepID=UPI0039831EBC
TVLHLEGFDVKYTGGHNYYDYRLQTDLDGTARTTNFLVTQTTPNVLPATATNPLGLGTTNIPPQGIFVSPRQHNQYHEEVWWFSNELNFASTTDGPAQWLFGIYQYREGSNYQLTDARYPDDPRFETPFNPLTQTPVAPNPLRNYAIGASENVNESYAAYGQIDYKLTEAWKLTAGLRYTLDKKQSFESARLFCFISPSPACIGRNTGRVFDVTNLAIPAVPVASQDRSVVVPLFTDPTTGLRHRLLEQEWDAVTGTVGLDWKPDSDTLAYVKYTRGYKAGGFNAGTVTLQQRVTTKEEIIDAYEVGLKKTFGGTFQANASAFYYKYSDIQVPLAGFNEVLQANTTEFFNLDEAIIKGFELETTWQPIDGLQILANYSYLDAQVEKGCCFQDPDDPLAIQPGAIRAPIQPSLTSINQDLKGATLPSSTPHRVTVNANYTWRFDPGRLTGSVTYVWRDDTYYSLFNRYYSRAKAFETVDARVLFSDRDDRYTVIGYVKNIFDAEGLAGISGARLNQPFPATQGRINQTLNLIAPRTYGLELQYRF